MHRGGLVKTHEFASPKYVGDPINAVKIFNEKEADELMLLDIDASVNQAEPNYFLIERIAAECRMPLCYGGGVTDTKQVARIISLGVEKVAVSSAAVADPTLVSRMAEAVGSQSVVVVLDVRRKRGLFARGWELRTLNGKQAHGEDPLEMAVRLQQLGAGEIVVNSIDRDGQMQGYDLEFARAAREAISVPLTVLGGAGTHEDVIALLRECGVVGAAAGSLFVFKGRFRAVLINYPTQAQKDGIFRAASLLPS